MLLLFVVCCRWIHQVHIFLGKLLQWGKMSLMQRHFLKRGIRFDSLASYMLEKLFFFFFGGGGGVGVKISFVSIHTMKWIELGLIYVDFTCTTLLTFFALAIISSYNIVYLSVLQVYRWYGAWWCCPHFNINLEGRVGIVALSSTSILKPLSQYKCEGSLWWMPIK